SWMTSTSPSTPAGSASSSLTRPAATAKSPGFEMLARDGRAAARGPGEGPTGAARELPLAPYGAGAGGAGSVPAAGSSCLLGATSVGRTDQKPEIGSPSRAPEG